MDRWSALEDEAMDQANSMDIGVCRQLGVKDSFLEEWTVGAVLEGGDLAPHYFLDDYPNLRDNKEVAAEELDRLTGLG